MCFKKDLAGQKFGKLTVLSYSHSEKNGAHWKVRCDCGNVTVKAATHMKQGATSSCGCIWHPIVDLAGKVFGKWTVLRVDEAPRKTRNLRWICRCECGTEKSVVSNTLVQGRSTSCPACGATRHGATKNGKETREYSSWKSAKKRCTQPNNARWDRYGARGIYMDAEWVNDFAQFLKDMGPCPEGHSLDRKDNNGPYSAENCRWATTAQQARNRGTNRMVTFENETLCMEDWALKLGINVATLHWRRRGGWSIEKMLTTPVKGSDNLAV